MLDDQTRRLLHEIDENEVVKAYMREVCSDMRGVLQKISVCVSVQHDTHDDGSSASAGSEHHRYEQTMHTLLNLGTTRNITHPESVRNCDVDGVLRCGNIRERCAVLMNMLCHDKKYSVIHWLLGQVACAEKCRKCCHSQGVCGAYLPWLLATLNSQQLLLYKNAVGMCLAGGKICSKEELCAKKDIRKALCRVVNCPRKNTRVARSAATQQQYAMHANDAIPRLSWRELSLQHAYASNSLVQLRSLLPNRSLCFPVQGGDSGNPMDSGTATSKPSTMPWTANAAYHNAYTAHVCTATSKANTMPWTANASNAAYHHASSAHVCTATSKDNTMPWTANDSNAAYHHTSSAHVASTQRAAVALRIMCATSGAKPSCPGTTLPWLTGHMCWKMVHESAFFMHATRHGENVIAGPSGHTHAMLTFMSIFRNFDIEKWTLVCLVWLVGADHHSVFEVLSAAARHGLHMPPNTPSIDIARELLQKISA